MGKTILNEGVRPMFRVCKRPNQEVHPVRSSLRKRFTPLDNLSNGARVLQGSSAGLSNGVNLTEGAVSSDGRVWGTYIHGIFDNDQFRRSFVNLLRREKGMSPRETQQFSYNEEKERSFNLLANLVRENLNMSKLYQIIFNSH